MPAVITITGVGPNGTDNTASTVQVYGSIVLSGTYAAGGFALDFTGFDQIKSSGPPLFVDIQSGQLPGSPNTGQFQYSYTYPASGIKTGTIQIFTGAAAQSALAELSAGALPAGVTGDKIRFQAIFPKNI